VVTSPSMGYETFKNFVFSKTDPELCNEVLERELDIENNRNNTPSTCNKKNISKLNTYIQFLPYEIESTLAKVFEQEIILIEQISSQLDKFFLHKSFNVYSLIRKLDTTYHNYIDELE
jgi:hypothetical protein